jgi:hypothetical protein
MPRSRQRLCLQDGLQLDLNHLAKKGFIRLGANIGARGIVWNNSYWGEVARGEITADMNNGHIGWFCISIGGLEQRIILFSKPRHFGGRQWYFVCPVTNELASVLWRPNGATDLPAGMPGGGKSPIGRNSMIRPAEPTPEKSGSESD